METLTIALWATNLEPPLMSLADWTARIEARMAEAQAAGAGWWSCRSSHVRSG